MDKTEYVDDKLKKLSDMVSDLTRRGDEFLHDERVQQQISKVRENTKDIISKYPVGAIVTGAVIGYMLGRLFRSED